MSGVAYMYDLSRGYIFWTYTSCKTLACCILSTFFPLAVPETALKSSCFCMQKEKFEKLECNEMQYATLQERELASYRLSNRRRGRLEGRRRGRSLFGSKGIGKLKSARYCKLAHQDRSGNKGHWFLHGDDDDNDASSRFRD